MQDEEVREIYKGDDKSVIGLSIKKARGNKLVPFLCKNSIASKGILVTTGICTSVHKL